MKEEKGFAIEAEEIDGSCVCHCNQKIITQIIKEQDEATIKVIERYCEEKDIIPNIIGEDKLELVLRLGIAELNKRNLENKGEIEK